MTGVEIPCDKDTIADICEHDPEIANGLVFRSRLRSNANNQGLFAGIHAAGKIVVKLTSSPLGYLITHYKRR